MKKFYLFSQIQDIVLSNEADIGVIIHESRFTYAQKGLIKVMDLGEYWEGKTGMPTPLGGIAIKRDLPQNIKVDINELLQKSIEYAFNNTTDVLPYVKCYAQEMDADVMIKHIELYVNKYSLSLGDKGRLAVIELLKASGRIHPDFDERNFFID